jgi:glycosyltransferase involved in cell wall biosynthesis
MTLISVVAPIYNEEQNIIEFLNRVKNNLDKITNDFKIILIDDGSKDRSWNLIQQESEKSEKIIGLKLSKNFGHHYAITAGIHVSKSDWVIVMDSDLQDRPEVIPDLYSKAKEGFDVVFVNRTKRPESVLYLLLQKLFYFSLRVLSGIKFDSRQANFSIISCKVVESFKMFPEKARFYPSTVMWLGFRRAEIEAEHGVRYKGKASYSFKKRVQLAVDIILAFSHRPLKFAIWLGIVISIISYLMFIWIIVRKLTFGFSIEGWTSIMAFMFFIGGTVLVVLGINGVYLGKIFEQVKNRPLYIIEDSKGINQ